MIVSLDNFSWYPLPLCVLIVMLDLFNCFIIIAQYRQLPNLASDVLKVVYALLGTAFNT